MTPPVALTIAGSDASGGAGVHADLRTFAAFGVHGATVFAALTAQNTAEVRAVHRVPTDFVTAQFDAVVDDLDVRAAKTGFLGDADTIRAVAERAARLPMLVVDPVLVSATGARLLTEAAEHAYRSVLLPAATVITPNRREAGVLLERPVDTVDDMIAAAVDLAAWGPTVVVKGGDAIDEGDDATDVVVFASAIDDVPASPWLLRTPMLDTRNDHGTGCSFAAAIVALVAHGRPLPYAIGVAKAFVHGAIAGAVDWRLGAGHGPIDQFGWKLHES